MKNWLVIAGLLFVSWFCLAQTKPSDKTQTPVSLTEQNPSVVPNLYELGRRVGVNEEDHGRLQKVEDRVDDIRGTISWMRGAWWALGVAVGLVLIVVKFFGPSLFVAIDHRMERARADAILAKEREKA